MTSATPPVAESRPGLVLDTNVVLDWLVFRDAGCDVLADAIRKRRVRWVASQAMRDELERVLARGSLDTWKPDVVALWTAWDQWAVIVRAPAVEPPGFPRCTDPDDQKFISLGLYTGARALLSRDRAVLRCARGARALGLEILTPSAWAAR